MRCAHSASVAQPSRTDGLSGARTPVVMTIQLFYFDGCPSYERALGNLNEAMRQQGLTVPVELVRVTSVEDAQAKQFLGSPTIRINGTDLETRRAFTSVSFGLGCRIYQKGRQTAGWPSIELIRKALESAQG